MTRFALWASSLASGRAILGQRTRRATEGLPALPHILLTPQIFRTPADIRRLFPGCRMPLLGGAGHTDPLLRERGVCCVAQRPLSFAYTKGACS
jgi:hypothetical protein